MITPLKVKSKIQSDDAYDDDAADDDADDDDDADADDEDDDDDDDDDDDHDDHDDDDEDADDSGKPGINISGNQLNSRQPLPLLQVLMNKMDMSPRS